MVLRLVAKIDGEAWFTLPFPVKLSSNLGMAASAVSRIVGVHWMAGAQPGRNTSTGGFLS
jgi:hypothetical protein